MDSTSQVDGYNKCKPTHSLTGRRIVVATVREMDKHSEKKAGNMESASSCFLQGKCRRPGILEREEESTLSGVLGGRSLVSTEQPCPPGTPLPILTYHSLYKAVGSDQQSWLKEKCYGKGFVLSQILVFRGRHSTQGLLCSLERVLGTGCQFFVRVYRGK